MDNAYNKVVEESRSRKRPDRTNGISDVSSPVDDLEVFMGEKSIVNPVIETSSLLKAHKQRLERIFTANAKLPPQWWFIESVIRVLCATVPSFHPKVSERSWLSHYNRKMLDMEWCKAVMMHRAQVIDPLVEQAKKKENQISLFADVIAAFDEHALHTANLACVTQEGKHPSRKMFSKVEEGSRILVVRDPFMAEQSDQAFNIRVVNLENAHTVLDLYVNLSVSDVQISCILHSIYFLIMPWRMTELRDLTDDGMIHHDISGSLDGSVVSTCFTSAARMYRAVSVLRSNSDNLKVS